MSLYMDLNKILEKKGLEAGDRENKRAEDYLNKHSVKFKKYELLTKEYNTLKEIAEEAGQDVEDYEVGSIWHIGRKIFKVEIEDEHVVGLQISRYNLRKLPENIADLRHLRRLNVEWNQLEILPEAIGNLKQLKYLNVMFNKLDDSARQLIGSLRNKGVQVYGIRKNVF